MKDRGAIAAQVKAEEEAAKAAKAKKALPRRRRTPPKPLRLVVQQPPRIYVQIHLGLIVIRAAILFGWA